MKKRRLMIIAFLLTATLVMGVGYAAVSGTLGITGRVEFNGTSVVSTDVKNSVKFTKATAGDNCTASVTGDHAADMNVVFNDTAGTAGAVFTATATYTITYESEDTTLPDITFSVPAPTVTSAAGSPGFAITTSWADAEQTLSVGESIDITVTVTYTNQTPVETGTVTASINVPLPYVSVETTTTSGT